MRSNRSKACDISPKVREEVLERDKGCIICGSRYNLDIAHYIPRSKGGLGISQNLVVLCREHHHCMDNGRSKEISDNLNMAVKSYLHSKYVGTWDISKLKYDKFSWLKEIGENE